MQAINAKHEYTGVIHCLSLSAHWLSPATLQVHV